MNEYKDRKITRTSFLDDAFRKNLESALRFGNPLLVQVRQDLVSTNHGGSLEPPEVSACSGGLARGVSVRATDLCPHRTWRATTRC